MKTLAAVLKSRQEAKNTEGFSLLEMVVAMGILIVLTVGGILAYDGITDNARQAAVDTAAKSVYTSAVAYESDNSGITDRETAEDDYNTTTDGTIIVTITPKDQGDIFVTATNYNTGQVGTAGTPPTTD
jgi:type II secretory pathway pseudopilin PulG